MTDSEYSFRLRRRAAETTFRQDDDGLHWVDAHGRSGSVAYGQISKVQVSKFRFFRSRSSYWRCVLVRADGAKICLQAAHYAGFRQIEDRTAAYIPFIKRLEGRIAAANPTCVFEDASHWGARIETWIGCAIVIVLRAARIVPLPWLSPACSWLLRTIGPMLKGHRVARANLEAAFPEKTPDEINRILAGMWSNLGCVVAEYVHLDKLWDFDPADPTRGRILIDDVNRRRFIALNNATGPALLFGAHLANWELLIWCVGSRGGETAVVYRPTRIAPIDRRLLELRRPSKASLIAAGASAVFSTRNALHRGAQVGFLVDEHFARGIDVTFFGRACKATPLFARYARQFDCPIYGGRLIRLDGNRFRLDMTEPLQPPRDADGKIDVAATTQMMTSIIEGWIRENPEQWCWLLRRWR